MGFLHPGVWLAIFAILLIIEALTMGLTTIWFAGGAFIAFLFSLPFNNWIVEIIVFFFVSLLLLIFTRPLAVKFVTARKTKTNYESLIGQSGKVSEKIDNDNNTGTVILNGLEWTARSINSETTIEVEEKVEVKQIEGVKLIVTKAK